MEPQMNTDVRGWMVKVAGVVMALVGSVLFAGCDRGDSGGAGLQKVTITLNWYPEPEFGGIYAAKEMGIFEKHGLDVTIVPGGPQVPSVQLTATGRSEFGVAGADEVLTVREKGADVIGIFTIYQTNPQGIMTHASKNFGSIADLWKAPITLAVQPGLPYVDFLKQSLGQPAAKLVAYDGGVGKFLADDNMAQQCFIFAEPIAAKNKGADVRTFLIAETGYNPYAGLVIANGDFARKNPAVVKAMVEAMREGWRAYLDDPRPANEVMAKINTQMDLPTFAAAAEAQEPLVENEYTERHGLGTMSRERWETLAGQLADLKVISKRPADVGECFLNP
jgi:NitT/TauT family transport system substrate-binding protein